MTSDHDIHSSRGNSLDSGLGYKMLEGAVFIGFKIGAYLDLLKTCFAVLGLPRDRGVGDHMIENTKLQRHLFSVSNQQ